MTKATIHPLPDRSAELDFAISPFRFPATLEEARTTARGRKTLELYERARDISMKIDANVESTIRFHANDTFAFAHPLEDSDTMLGMIHWAFVQRGTIMVIQGLSTDPAYERQGVGGALLGHARDRAMGCAAIRLTSLPAAVSFYERHGFRRTSSHIYPDMALVLGKSSS